MSTSPRVSSVQPMPLREAKLTLLLADLTGYTRAVASMDALDAARMLDPYYRSCAKRVAAQGGRIVKFMGDACFAAFPEERTVEAVECALGLRDDVANLKSSRWTPHLGANLHLGTVAEGTFGLEDDLRYDVLGAGVNHLFLMGGGAGIRVSEPVYRKLPNERRGPFVKHKAPVTYRLD